MTRSIPVIAVAIVTQVGCSLSQAPLTCDIGQGSWFAQYTLLAPGSIGACANKTGEGLGIRKYFPDGQKPQVAIRTDTLGNLALMSPGDPDATHHPESMGALTADSPDASQFCSISTFTKSEQNVPASAGGPGDITYEWSDVRFVVRTNVPGTQMVSHLRYTEPGCTAEYRVVAMQPFKDCTLVDAQSNPILDSMGNPQPDDSACRGPLSGVNPDFAVRCDRAMLRCVLINDPPSLN